MRSGRKKFTSIDDYIDMFPGDVREKLLQMRKVISEQAPQAQEKISYQMPTFYLNGNLVHFAAYAKHIGFYPSSSGIKAFEHKLAKYKFSKGAVQFPIDDPLPVVLIRQIVRFRVAENLKKE